MKVAFLDLRRPSTANGFVDSFLQSVGCSGTGSRREPGILDSNSILTHEGVECLFWHRMWGLWGLWEGDLLEEERWTFFGVWLSCRNTF